MANSTQPVAIAGRKGGTLKISKIYPDPSTGKFDYRGTKGQKIEWEMVPMGELFVEEGTIPGDSAHTLTGADGTIWHPSGRWAATVVRLCGGIAILDAEKNFDPVAFLQFNKDSPDQYRGHQDRQGSLGGHVRSGFSRPGTRSASRRTDDSSA